MDSGVRGFGKGLRCKKIAKFVPKDVPAPVEEIQKMG
jgi:hypothetical protein